MKQGGKSAVFVTLLALLLSVVPSMASAETIRDITFPVDGEVTYTDSFGDDRSGGRTHEGIDLMGAHMTPLVAAVDGYISYITIPEASWGYGLTITDSAGWDYWYLHINNDTPGTDDGIGGLEYAFAPGIRRGTRVTAGQLVAWMGDSGNAEYSGNHLHFEIHDPNDRVINPFESLKAAESKSFYYVMAELEAAPTISEDKGLIQLSGSRNCATGMVMSTAASDSVYYCGADGKRYVFPNQKTYDTWYDGWGKVTNLSAEVIASIPFGGMVNYRPGVRLVKIQSDPKVYAVAKGGVLRWVTSESIAEGLYGADWTKQVDDVPVAFFTNYTLGEPITAVE
jgi:hypothetical protein